MAGIGKPAIYRRFSDKAALVAHVISRQLPSLDPPDLVTHAPSCGSRSSRASLLTVRHM